MSAPYYDTESGYGGYTKATWPPATSGEWIQRWDQSSHHSHWAEVGTGYYPVAGVYRHTHGYIRVHTPPENFTSRPMFNCQISNFNSMLSGRSKDVLRINGMGIQGFYSNWGVDIAEADWSSFVTPATSVILGTYINAHMGSLYAPLAIPLINTSLIDWVSGATFLAFRITNETLEPTELSTLNCGSDCAILPGAVGPPSGLTIAPLPGGPASTRNGVRGVGSRA